eukprot:3266104-Pleurochrysis_carterae.AAC.1
MIRKAPPPAWTAAVVGLGRRSWRAPPHAPGVSPPRGRAPPPRPEATAARSPTAPPGTPLER